MTITQNQKKPAGKSKKKGRIIIVDNYRKEGTKSVRQLSDHLKDQGYQPKIIRHSDAKKILSDGTDFLKGAVGYVRTGSGKSWSKTGKTDSNGRHYLKRKDKVAKYLTNHHLPGYSICASFHEDAQNLGYKVINTGKFNSGKGKDGHAYNHKYAVLPSRSKNIDDRVSDVETIEHKRTNERVIKAFNYDNKRSVQYHPEKTEKGKKELTNFLDQKVKEYRN